MFQNFGKADSQLQRTSTPLLLAVTPSLRQPPPPLANLACQPDRIWNHVEDTTLSTSVRVFPERSNRGRKAWPQRGTVRSNRWPEMKTRARNTAAYLPTSLLEQAHLLLPVPSSISIGLQLPSLPKLLSSPVCG